MARPRKPDVSPQTNSLVASAIRLPKVSPGRVTNGEAWQNAAWSYYDICPELRFTANWVGNVMGRAELLITEETGLNDEVKDGGSAYESLVSYFKGQHGQAEMLRATGIHLTVAGECYHYYRAETDEWRVLAVGKVKQQGNGKQARVVAEWDGTAVEVKPKDVMIRVWNPHPMDPQLADSPTRANLETLAEIAACSAHIKATLMSRLAGNGVLFIPQDITFPIPANMDPQSSSADVFMQVLGEAMTTPIQDSGSASAVVPVVVQAPGDSLNQIKHVTFWSELDASVKEMREAAVKRFALGMDIPPEILTGMAQTNHWNAWLVDEASVKAHTEPRLAVVTNAITTAYLQPSLKGVEDEPSRWSIIADTSNLRLRPNRSKEAIELYDRGALTEAALRRETGFETEDAPTRNEFMEWLLRKIATGSTSPEQTQAAVEALGVNLPVLDPLGPGLERPSQVDNIRSLDEHPGRSIAPLDGVSPADLNAASLLASCDVLVYRALERAGNRLKSQASYVGKTAAADLYLDVKANVGQMDRLMEDAWSCLPRVLGDDLLAASVTPLLDGYVRGLLMNQSPHTRTAMTAALATGRRAVG